MNFVDGWMLLAGGVAIVFSCYYDIRKKMIPDIASATMWGIAIWFAISYPNVAVVGFATFGLLFDGDILLAAPIAGVTSMLGGYMPVLLGGCILAGLLHAKNSGEEVALAPFIGVVYLVFCFALIINS
jgi:hypothetical protein